jgi:hypothetical protein
MNFHVKNLMTIVYDFRRSSWELKIIKTKLILSEKFIFILGCLNNCSGRKTRIVLLKYFLLSAIILFLYLFISIFSDKTISDGWTSVFLIK